MNRTATMESLIAGYRNATERVEWYSRNLSPDQLTWRPGADRWSVSECIRHLTVSNRTYLPKFDLALLQLRERGATGRGPFRFDLVGRIFIGTMEPPAKLKMPAPTIFRVIGEALSPTLFPDFATVQNELIERIEASSGWDLTKAKISSPASNLIRFNVAAAFEIIAAHERRHLWQADNVIASEGFPG